MAVTVMGKDSSPTPQRQVRSKIQMSMFDSYPPCKPPILAIGCLAFENQEHHFDRISFVEPGRTGLGSADRVMTPLRFHHEQKGGH